MASDLEELPMTVQHAIEWSTHDAASDAGLFDEDPDIADRVRSMASAVLDADLAGHHEILVDLLTVMGAVPPHVHGPLLLFLGQKEPKAVTKAFGVLENGNDAQRFAYRSLIETFGRFGRHSLLVDIMADDEILDHVRRSVERARGEKR